MCRSRLAPCRTSSQRSQPRRRCGLSLSSSDMGTGPRFWSSSWSSRQFGRYLRIANVVDIGRAVLPIGPRGRVQPVASRRELAGVQPAAEVEAVAPRPVGVGEAAERKVSRAFARAATALGRLDATSAPLDAWLGAEDRDRYDRRLGIDIADRRSGLASFMTPAGSAKSVWTYAQCAELRRRGGCRHHAGREGCVSARLGPVDRGRDRPVVVGRSWLQPRQA